MKLSKEISLIINKLSSDNIINDKVSNIINGIKSHKDFLYIDISDKDDYVSFIPNKKSFTDKLIYTLSRPTLVEVSHKIYSNAVEAIGIDNLSNISQSIRKNNTFKILGIYPSGGGYDNYKIYHMLDTITNKEILNADHDMSSFILLEDSLSEIKKSEIKIGRFLSKITDKNDVYKNLKDSDVESFVNSFKAHNLFIRNIQNNFKVVKGRSVRAWYNGKRYSKENTGILSKSCMRYKSCKDFFDMYVNKKNNVKMLILRNDDGKLIGRALLWDDTSKGKYMDRIYGQDYIITAFLKWGELNGYNISFNQGNYGNISVKVEIDLEDSFPYLDTFQFMNTKSNNFGIQEAILSNNSKSLIPENTEIKYYSLTKTDGGYSSQINYDNNY